MVLEDPGSWCVPKPSAPEAPLSPWGPTAWSARLQGAVHASRQLSSSPSDGGSSGRGSVFPDPLPQSWHQRGLPAGFSQRWPRVFSGVGVHRSGPGPQRKVGAERGVSCRAGFDEEIAGDYDTQEHKGLPERSQAVGAVLSLLLVALTGCLLTLLLYKKEPPCKGEEARRGPRRPRVKPWLPFLSSSS